MASSRRRLIGARERIHRAAQCSLKATERAHLARPARQVGVISALALPPPMAPNNVRRDDLPIVQDPQLNNSGPTAAPAEPPTPGSMPGSHPLSNPPGDNVPATPVAAFPPPPPPFFAHTSHTRREAYGGHPHGTPVPPAEMAAKMGARTVSCPE
eukprot:scaffold16232_cov126-Isochrysis_galbana.AAC.1